MTIVQAESVDWWRTTNSATVSAREQGQVARQDQHVAVAQVVLDEGGHAGGGGVGRAPGPGLLDEVHRPVGQLLADPLGDALGAGADDHHGLGHRAVRQRVEHVEEHRPPAQQVQGLGPVRTASGCPIPLPGPPRTTTARSWPRG